MVPENTFVVSVRVSLLCFILLAAPGCQLLGGSGSPDSGSATPPPRFSDLVPSPGDITQQQVRISKEKFSAAVTEAAGLPEVRVVPVFRRTAERQFSGVPEYRIFQVHPSSPFALMGVHDGDILLALHDFILLDPEVVPFFPRALLVDRNTSLLIRREGKLINLQIELDAMAGGTSDTPA
ncbi:MAG: hypothetical protein KDD60_07565 [Bdellovibrionales bacterium]|nr:hypothetical protein [Bdellovibrionales bacterium]